MTSSPPNFETGQILNVDKPKDWTSFDVVKKIRSYITPAKVGHAGTLDPFATGVLLLCTGRATKRVSALMALEKEYVATIELGKCTDTYDVTGTILKIGDYTSLKHSEITEACARFTGEIEQIPPMYSAVKINGERLYKKARRGEVVEREPRRVYIHEIQVNDVQLPLFELKVVCSKGTYIRALANDVGEVLGCGAYLKALRRTRIGPYEVENAWSIQALVEAIESPVFA